MDSFCKWVCSDFYLNHSQPVTVRLKIFVTSGMESLCLPPSILRILACTWGLNARNVDMEAITNRIRLIVEPEVKLPMAIFTLCELFWSFPARTICVT